jgi:hypothetical protein
LTGTIDIREIIETIEKPLDGKYKQFLSSGDDDVVTVDTGIWWATG